MRHAVSFKGAKNKRKVKHKTNFKCTNKTLAHLRKSKSKIHFNIIY